MQWEIFENEVSEASISTLMHFLNEFKNLSEMNGF
jgi:hypothetical protein